MEGPAAVRKDRGSEKQGGGRQEGGRDSGSKGHSCGGLMPRVEELELEPRNVPQRTLKREVKREGLLRKRRARASQRSRRFAGGGEGTVLVILIHRVNLHLATSTATTAPQALWQ